MRMLQNDPTQTSNDAINMDNFVSMLRDSGHSEESEILRDFEMNQDPKHREKLIRKQEAHEERLRKERQRFETEFRKQEGQFEKEMKRFQKEAEDRYKEMEEYYRSKPRDHINVPKNVQAAVNAAKEQHKIDDIMVLPKLISQNVLMTSSFILFQMELFPMNKALCAFDCLIVLLQDTLGEEEVFIARTAIAHKQNVVFVRSRCDLDFNKKNESTDVVMPTQKEAKEHVKQLKETFKKQIQRMADDLNNVKIFFISANSLRALVNGNTIGFAERKFVLFEEQDFLDHLMKQSKKSRGVY
uniref:Uncharacterized protein n=1 Tax=Acrobeloides nanus TaxID=290746 RepID=A0A914CHK3_9BILA